MTDGPDPSHVRQWLRRPWLLLPIKLVLVLVPTILLSIALGPYLRSQVHASPYESQAIVEPIGAVISMLLFALYTRRVERRAALELGLRGAPRELLIGFVVGILVISLVIAILALTGCYRVTGFNSWTSLGLPLLAAAGAALFEELLLRGVLFRIAEDSLGSYWALALSAAVFGALHLVNPNSTLPAAFAIMIEAGIFLGAAYMLTRRLWLPIGIHMGWNFAEEGLWGTSVSGTAAHGLTRATLNGPDWLTGGAFGPEASVVATVVCGAIGVMLFRYVARDGRLKQPFWRRRGLSGA